MHSNSTGTNIKDVFEDLLKDSKVNEVLHYIESESLQTLADQIELTKIPAPTFKEQKRACYFKQKFNELGLIDVKIDALGNVIGTKKGTGFGPNLVVSAHLDTVFPPGTEINVIEKEGRIYAPGIADDGRGLTTLLTLIKVFNKFDVNSVGDILFVATVGEEGLGDLRGVKSLFENRKDIDGFISIEPGSPARIIYLATGSLRYSVTYKGLGGHSFGDFGTPSAIHALGRAISMISNIETIHEPKTTFNVGTITGGTSVNTIAQEASMIIDLRSTSQVELSKLEKKVLSIVNVAAEDENNRWNRKELRVEIELVGDRPAGSQNEEAVIVQVAEEANRRVGVVPELAEPTSTDSNVPISLGIPAITLGGGGTCGGIHTLQEWFDPTDSHLGVQQIFLTILGLVGFNDVTSPLLESR
jgi:tripeptide aminopeptidase